MKTMLIVEDEKMIRQGIHVMVNRSNVEIEEVLECRNGLEALDILKRCKVDVMFTDIRMPKMDGIELVKAAKTLKKPPKIVVLSGYDDFNYAVEMLKHGVEDYILKPIKREKIEEILKKLDKQLQMEEIDRDAESYIFGKQFLHYLKNPVNTDEEKKMEIKFKQYIQDKEYYIVIYGSTSYISLQEDFIRIEHNGQIFHILGEKGLYAAENAGLCAGISSIHASFSECRIAYSEAVAARHHAWINKLSHYKWEGMLKEGENVIDEEFASRLALKLSTEHWEEGIKQYRNLFFCTEHRQLREEDLISQAIKLNEELWKAYSSLFDKEETVLTSSPLSFVNSEAYMSSFLDLAAEIRSRLSEKYDNSRNQNKVRAAVQYIRENYKKDLNMAMVSNYVSMNYSLFSILFKEHTGVNFVTYLKNLRLEEAKRMLRETDEKVRDIGKAVGFENDKNFLKSFKASLGVSPTEYRRTEECKENNDNQP